LVSFYVCDENSDFKYPFFKKEDNLILSQPIDVKMETYHLNLKILGLRNLKSAGLLPVKKPIIKIDIDSLYSNVD